MRRQALLPKARSRSGHVRIALYCGLMLAPLLTAQTKELKPQTITVCDLFKNLLSHADKMVSVRGILYQGTEIFALGGHCDNKFVTKYTWAPALQGLPDLPPTGEFVWPTALDLKPASFIEEGERAVDFKTDEADLHEVLAVVNNQRAKMKLMSGKTPEVSITVIGQLRVKARYEIGKRADGTPIGGGYGHLNTYPAQLVIATMHDPVVR